MNTPRGRWPLMLALLALCASGPVLARHAQAFRVVLRDAPLAAGSDAAAARRAAAWQTYAAARIDTLTRLRASRRFNGSADDYAVERDGRRALARAWRAERTRDAALSDPYLDLLDAIDGAGYTEEYVLEQFARPGWTIPVTDFAAIDLRGWERWKQAHPIPSRSPQPLGVEMDGAPEWPVAPGASLPDPRALTPAAQPCAGSLPALRRSVDAWRNEARRLVGNATALPPDTGGFDRIVGHPERYRRGATLVDPRVGMLAFLAGFCAVDVQDFAAAEPLLRLAVELSPWHYRPKLELAQVYVHRRRFDAVDTIVDEVLATESDGCALAVAWRKRGFVRFEQGRLDEARAAYLRSLDFEPDSAIARSELALLNREIVGKGGAPVEYRAPPMAPQVVTRCSAPGAPRGQRSA